MRRNHAFNVLMAPLQYGRGLVPLVLGLAIWQAFGPAKSPYFPPPGAWLDSIVFLARSGRLWPAFAATLTTFALGITLASAIGFILGLLIGRSRGLRRALGPLLEFCRGLPPPVLVPVAVLLLGYAESLKLLVVVWVSVWPVLLNTVTASGLLDELLIDVSRTFHFNAITTLRKIVAPAAVPAFLLGVRNCDPPRHHHHAARRNVDQPTGHRQPDRDQSASVQVCRGLRTTRIGRRSWPCSERDLYFI